MFILFGFVTGAQEILADLEILREDFRFNHAIVHELIKKRCCKRAYLRGAFLAGGSVNNPETSSYHLEIYSLYKEHSDALCELMNEFDLNAKTIRTKKGIYCLFKRS